MERIEKKSGDLILLTVLILLLGIGLTALFTASLPAAQRLFRDPLFLFKRQLIWVALGTLLGVVASRTPLAYVRQGTPWILFATLGITLLTFVPGIGIPVLGARRWIFLGGQSFQPSELVKLAIPLYLAAILDKKRDRIGDPLNTLVPPLLIVMAFTALIYLQNDFSTAVFILVLACLIFFLADVRLRYFLLFGTLALPLGGVLLFSKAHRVMRLIAFLNPLADPEGGAFQVIASRAALVQGRLWGVGLGQGVRKSGGLPEAHSDFIFSAFGEEVGFVGAVAIFVLFCLFAWRGYAASLQRRDSYGYYLGIGLTSALFLQAVLNLGVVTTLIPATGIPLPFFSAGGSSMLVSLTLSGLLMNLSRERGEGSERV